MDDAPVTVRVAPELVLLLRPRDRPARERRLGHDADATVGHVVQAAGVPLTEAGGLRLDGVPTVVGARPGRGSVAAVAAVPRPQPVPRGGFLLDSQRQIEGLPSLLYPEGQSAANLHAGHGATGPAPETQAPTAGGHNH